MPQVHLLYCCNNSSVIFFLIIYNSFRYHDKRIDGIYEEGKRSYCQERGMTYVPENKKGNKLKHSIKYLEV